MNESLIGQKKETMTMKVFLSFAGPCSKDVALALRDWLPKVIQAVRPFISEDITKGERWSDEIADELNQTKFGIICVTPYNLRTPWINFEAGAISKAVENQSYVCPFLFNMDKSSLKGPLEQFQCASYDMKKNEVVRHDEVFKLLSSINKRLDSEQQLSHVLLKEEFEIWWKDLQDKLTEILSRHYDETETGFPWLYDSEGCQRQLEKERDKCKKVWVVTADLYRHALAPQAIMTLYKESNIDHSFFYVESKKNNETKDAMLKQFELKQFESKRPNVKPIAEEQFRHIAVTDYIILNPDGGEDPLNVFCELPIKELDHWIKVDAEAALGIVTRFREQFDNKKTHDTSGNPENLASPKPPSDGEPEKGHLQASGALG